MYRRIVRGLAAVGLGAAVLGAVSGALVTTASAAAVTAAQSSASARHAALAGTSTGHPTAADPRSRDNTDRPKKNPLDTRHGYRGEQKKFKDWWDYL